MIRHFLTFTLIGCFLVGGSPIVAAEGNGLETGFFPPAHELFTPLKADPRELQYSLRRVVPVGSTALGEAAIGDYLGVYRWRWGGGERWLQVSMGGGVFGRFDIDATTNDLQVADFYANLPVDLLWGRWSSRLMVYHVSSHLGDDYVRGINESTEKNTWDAIRWLVSYQSWSWLRLYGGTTRILRTIPKTPGWMALQGGVEFTTPWLFRRHAQFYWAHDAQFWQRVGWNPAYNTQIGVKLVQNPSTGRGISLFSEFFAGRLPFGQFFLNKETHWTFGLKFDLT